MHPVGFLPCLAASWALSGHASGQVSSLGNLRGAQSDRLPQRGPVSSLREPGRCSRLFMVPQGHHGDGSRDFSCEPGAIKQRLDSQGYVLLKDRMPTDVVEYLPEWVDALRSAHAPGAGTQAMFSSMHLRWQKQYLVRGSGPEASWSVTPWTLVSARNCDRQTVRSLTGVHPVFNIADTFFSRLDNCLRPAFIDTDVSVMQEIRYIDPVGKRLSEDTYWHCDGFPVFLTAASSWMGPGTVFTPRLGLQDPQVNDPISVTMASPGDVLVFYGKAAESNALWHKSPQLQTPRLLLLYRLVKAGEEVAIRDVPD